MNNDIRSITKILMETVILEFSGVQMSSSVLVNSIVSDNSFEIKHSKEIRIIPSRGNKASTSASIGQLIISLEHQRSSMERLLSIINRAINFSSNIAKVFASSFSKFLNINFTSPRNNYIISNIIFIVELFNLVSSDGINIVSNTSGRLT